MSRQHTRDWQQNHKTRILVLGLLCGLGLALLRQPRRLWAADCTWDGSTSNWSASAHWSCAAIPSAGDKAFINSGVVSMDADFSVDALALAGGQLAGSSTLTVTQVMTWTGGTLQGPGLTVVALGASAELTGTAEKIFSDRTLRNFGTMTWGGTGNINIASNGGIDNRAGGLFLIENDQQIFRSDGSLTFTNAGTIRKENSNGVTSIGRTFGTFNNNGLVDVQSGTLELTGPGSGSGNGDFSVAAGTTLHFADGTLDLLDGSSLSGLGTVRFSGGAINIGGVYSIPVTIIDGGTARFNSLAATTPQAFLSGGALGGSGILTVTQVLSWTSGSFNDTGATVLTTGASADLAGAADHVFQGRTLRNFGTITWKDTGNINIASNGGIDNRTGGLFLIENDQQIFRSDGALTLNNSGTIRKHNSNGTTSIGRTFGTFNNDGLVEIQSGTFELTGPGAGSGSGDFTLAAGTTLHFADGNLDLLPGSSLSGLGTVRFSSGTINIGGVYSIPVTLIDGGVARFNSFEATTPQAFLSGGAMAGSGILTVTEVLSWTNGALNDTGATVLAPGAAVELSGTADKVFNDRTLRNFGTMTWAGTANINIASNGRIENKAGGLFLIENDQSIFRSDGALTLDNQGTIRKHNSNGVTSIDRVFGAFNNNGLVEVQSGTLRITGEGGGSSSGQFIVADGASLEFAAGNQDVTGDWQVAGQLRILGGSFTATAGEMTFSATGVQSLTVGIPATFHDITVMTDTILVEAVAADNITLGGALTNHGIVRKSKAVSAGANGFGLTGVQMNVTVTGTLASVSVDRIDSNHPDATTQTATHVYWQITPSGSGYQTDLTLPHHLADAETAQVCRFDGSIWECGRAGATATTVTRSGITELSDWTVGQVPVKVGSEIYLPKLARH